MNAADENHTTSSAPPRLTRSTSDKVVAGVCGGLGRHFAVDPVVFRIAFVVTALAGGSGVLLYLVAWLLVPDDHSGVTVVDRVRQGHRSQAMAAVLLAVGALVVLDGLGDRKGGGRFGGLVLLGVGAAVLWSRRGHSTTPLPPPAGPGSAPPPQPWAPPPPPPFPPSGPDEAPISDLATLEVPPVPASGPADPATAVMVPEVSSSEPTSAGSSPGQATSEAPTWPVPPQRGRDRRPSSVLVAVTLSLLAILAGVLALLGGTGTVDVPLGIGLALGLLVVGAALVVGAWRGRARWLVPLGVVLGVAVLATVAVDVPLRGGIGDRSIRPRTVGELRSPYRLAAGNLEVDLGGLDLGARTETVTATLGAGDLQVVVPDGAEVIVDAHVGAGTMTVFGRQFDGADNGHHLVEPGREGGGRLILSVRTGFGDLEVHHASS